MKMIYKVILAVLILFSYTSEFIEENYSVYNLMKYQKQEEDKIQAFM